MTTLKLLTIMNYRRRIIGFLHVIVYLLDIFDFGVWTRPNPWPTQDGEFCDPTQPDPTRPMSNSGLPVPEMHPIYGNSTTDQNVPQMSHDCPSRGGRVPMLCHTRDLYHLHPSPQTLNPSQPSPHTSFPISNRSRLPWYFKWRSSQIHDSTSITEITWSSIISSNQAKHS